MTPEEFKIIKDLESKLGFDKFEASNLYVVAETSENYHTGVTEVDYHYFILINGIFVKLNYEQFSAILSQCGYNISKETYHYQFEVLDSKWIEDYKENYYRFWCGDHYEYKFNPNDQSQLRHIFNKY